MPFLPALAVVFVGILGGGHTKAERQVTAMVKQLKLDAIKLLPPQVKALTHHGNGTRELVRGLHADGVVGFEIHDGTLRLVTYDGDGKLKTYLDTPIGPGGLDKDDLDTLRETLEADVSELRPKGHDSEPVIEIDPTPPPPARVAPPPKRAPAPVTTPPEAAPATVATPPQHAPAPVATPPEHAPAPVATAEATESVSVDEVEAMVSGGSVATTAAPHSERTVRIGAALGVGVTGRNFQPGLSTLPAYYSAAVGMVHLDGHIAPTERVDFGIVAERTLGMTTPAHDGMDATTISRWEAMGGYAMTSGAVVISPQLGIGRRSFAIESTDPSRSPDGEYDYLMLGVAARAELTSYLALKGMASFEPVIAGSEGTEMAFGEASRWALDVGVGVELRRGHLFARGAAEYQRFSWSWDDAGQRGGSGTDGYPSGTISLGADY